MSFTTNKPLLAWGRVPHDPDLADAMLDRVLERGRHLTLDRRRCGPVTYRKTARRAGGDPSQFPEIPAICSGTHMGARRSLVLLGRVVATSVRITTSPARRARTGGDDDYRGRARRKLGRGRFALLRRGYDSVPPYTESGLLIPPVRLRAPYLLRNLHSKCGGRSV